MAKTPNPRPFDARDYLTECTVELMEAVEDFDLSEDDILDRPLVYRGVARKLNVSALKVKRITDEINAIKNTL